MVNIDNSIEFNRKLLFAILILVVILLGLFAKFYFDQKKENHALRIKILSMSVNKRNPKPWSQLLSTPKMNNKLAMTTPSAAEIKPLEETKEEALAPLPEQDTAQIASTLGAEMRKVKALSLESIDKNIALADELISREPDSYSAYKAKLISLLVKEGKFGQAPDESELEGVLESMAQFNLSSDKLGRREASLIAGADSDIDAGEDRLAEIRIQLDVLEGQAGTLEPSSPEQIELVKKFQALQIQENEILANIASVENSVDQSMNQMVNEDMVEIPFMRMLAKGNYNTVAENAETFIKEFPNSPQGYFYLVRSLELQGQKEDSLGVIRNAQLSPPERQLLIQRLEQVSSEDPKDYWENLNF